MHGRPLPLGFCSPLELGSSRCACSFHVQLSAFQSAAALACSALLAVSGSDMVSASGLAADALRVSCSAPCLRRLHSYTHFRAWTCMRRCPARSPEPILPVSARTTTDTHSFTHIHRSASSSSRCRLFAVALPSCPAPPWPHHTLACMCVATATIPRLRPHPCALACPPARPPMRYASVCAAQAPLAGAVTTRFRPSLRTMLVHP